jgi:hypothetical protein
MTTDLKPNTYYTSGNTLFKILKINSKADNTLSVNAFYFVGVNRLYVEDLLVRLIRPFIEVSNQEVVKLLYE